MKNEDSIFFGHKKVSYDIKTRLVEKLFSNVYEKYDLMNDIMSVGIHRVWKDIFCLILDNPEAHLLDMAGGTGDITKRFHKFAESHHQTPKITMCDLNFDMLNKGKEKLINQGIIGVDYVSTAAENLPFKDESFDYYTVSFGIRNFTDISQSLREAKRVLNKGGKFLCLEFSKPQGAVLSNVYDIYSKFVIPNMGAAIGDRHSYEYLVESIERFPGQQEFANLISDAGFEKVSYRNLSGGIVAIHTAYKM